MDRSKGIVLVESWRWLRVPHAVCLHVIMIHIQLSCLHNASLSRSNVCWENKLQCSSMQHHDGVSIEHLGNTAKIRSFFLLILQFHSLHTSSHVLLLHSGSQLRRIWLWELALFVDCHASEALKKL